SHICDSTIVLIRPIDYPALYSAFRQKLRGAVEGFAMGSNDEALAAELGQLNAFTGSKAMCEADHQTIVFPQQLDRALPRLAPCFCGDTCQQPSACELSMQLVSRSIDQFDPRFRQLSLQGFDEPRELRRRQRTQYANSQRPVGETCPKLGLHFVAGNQNLLRGQM